ncbi:SMI1/KNR4 family protein [Streptomyces sp. NPDC059352]|uniref:SMI1/KNR4 family protein n=1 Tax=Streptomyces sp. NPDC059352 TaxID=3346810 RepID=UPI0036CBC69C
MARAEEPMRFDEIKASFWSGHTYGVQPDLTQATVAAAEHVLGLRLPTSLIDLLRVRNGGGVTADRDAFPTDQPTSWSEDHIPFTELMGIGTGGHGLSLLETPYLVEEWGLPSPVVLLSGDGHYWIGLDYRACGESGEPFGDLVRHRLRRRTAARGRLPGIRGGSSAPQPVRVGGGRAGRTSGCRILRVGQHALVPTRSRRRGSAAPAGTPRPTRPCPAM